MYPNHYFYHHPNNQTPYVHSTPFQTAHYFPESYDQRTFPMFPSQGGPMGPPPGTPGNWGTESRLQSGPPTVTTTIICSQLKHNNNKLSTFAVDPGSIRGCLFRYTYVWLNNRQQFWYYPTFVGRTSISGWRWTGFNWVFFGVHLRQIQSFTCL